MLEIPITGLNRIKESSLEKHQSLLRCYLKNEYSVFDLTKSERKKLKRIFSKLEKKIINVIDEENRKNDYSKKKIVVSAKIKTVLSQMLKVDHKERITFDKLRFMINQLK